MASRESRIDFPFDVDKHHRKLRWFVSELWRTTRWVYRHAMRWIASRIPVGGAKLSEVSTTTPTPAPLQAGSLYALTVPGPGNGKKPGLQLATSPVIGGELPPVEESEGLDPTPGHLSPRPALVEPGMNGRSALKASVLSRPRFPLRFKITLPFLALAAILGLAASYILSQIVLDTVANRFTSQMVEAGKLTSEWIVQEEEDLLNALRLISTAPGLGEAIDSADASQLREIVLPLAIHYSLQSTHILDRSGIALLSLNQSGESASIAFSVSQGSDFFQEIPLVGAVLSGTIDALGDQHAALVHEGESVKLYIAGPISNGTDELRGVVLVGISPTALVRGIREATLAQITIYDLSGKVLTTTLPGEIPGLDPDLAGEMLANRGGHGYRRDLINGDIDYEEIVAPFSVRGDDVLGLIGTSIPMTSLVSVSSRTRLEIIGFSASGMLLAIAAGYLIASHLVRPLNQLISAASAISDGNLKVQVSESGSDEVASLARIFNIMAASLDQATQDHINANQTTMDAYEKTIEGWAIALEIRDHTTEGHTRRVTDLTMKLALLMGFPEEEMIHLRRGALLHDIGKVGVPDSILLKPGSLDMDEWEIMRQHPAMAMRMLHHIEFLRPALDIPLSHHEKWDGSGYPQGLRNEDIPLAARIFSIIDVWDAITSDRPYRAAMPKETALQIIRDGMGTHFDPEVTLAFYDLLRLEMEEAKTAARRKVAAVSRFKTIVAGHEHERVME